MRRSLAAFSKGKGAAVLAFSGIGLAGCLSLLAIAAISLGFGSTRTFVVEAQTTGIQITFSGQANDWALGKVVVCTPRPRADPKLPRGTGVCDARGYTEEVLGDLRLVWTHDATVTVTTSSNAGQAVRLVLEISGQDGIADRTRVMLDAARWAEAGALTFNGTARIGEQLASGETKMLLHGSFEAREKPVWSATTEVLKSGLLRRGEAVSVVYPGADKPAPAEVFGHITAADQGGSGFVVGLVSAPGPVWLEVGFFGAAVPTLIAPTWIDRALTSPLVLALAALLSILISALQIVVSAGKAVRDLVGQSEPRGKRRGS